ncbi:MAG TPA: prepilin peptidase [Acidimicrobiia bacterium]
MTIVLVAVFGIALGALAHDLAVQGLREDPLRPFAGTCPRCRQVRGWQRITCPHCGRRVGREIVLALALALMAVVAYRGLGFTPHFLVYLGFFVLTAALTVTDLEEFRIVDRLNFPGTLILALALAAVALATGEGGPLLRGLLGAGAYFAGTSLMWVIAGGKGFGAGDVKLSPVLGLFTAFQSWGTLGWAVLITAFVGGLLGVAILLAGKGKDAELPYGPPMVIGAWTAIALALGGAIPLPA